MKLSLQHVHLLIIAVFSYLFENYVLWRIKRFKIKAITCFWYDACFVVIYYVHAVCFTEIPT